MLVGTLVSNCNSFAETFPMSFLSHSWLVWLVWRTWNRVGWSGRGTHRQSCCEQIWMWLNMVFYSNQSINLWNIFLKLHLFSIINEIFEKYNEIDQVIKYVVINYFNEAISIIYICLIFCNAIAYEFRFAKKKQKRSIPKISKVVERHSFLNWTISNFVFPYQIRILHILNVCHFFTLVNVIKK